MEMEIRAAGKPIPRGIGAKECLVVPEDTPRTPDDLKKFRQRTKPDVGTARSLFPTPPHVKEMEHGKKSKVSLNAGDLLNPQPKTLFQAKLTELQEKVYPSRSKAPLGEMRSGCLPSSIDPLKETFGRKIIIDDSAGLLVSPPKSRLQVEEESAVGKHLYRKSHNAFDVGEMVDRDYDWSVFTKDSKYGVPTPHDNTGHQVHISMNWNRGNQVVSKQLDDFREKTQPQLGTVHDPIAETLTVSPDHTFGTLVHPDEYGAGELLHTLGPSVYLNCKGFDKGVLCSLRHHLKQHKYTDFDHLLNGLKHLSSNGLVSKENVQKILFEFQVPLEAEMIELLLKWCSRTEQEERGGGGGIDYELLVQIINWKLDLDFPAVKVIIDNNTQVCCNDGATAAAALQQATDTNNTSDEQVTTTDERHKYDEESIAMKHNYKTSSQQVQATVGGISTNDYRIFGTPTIRSDRAPPRIRRVADHINYGDESDAHGLMYPSIYSSAGVYEHDFFVPRAPDQIRQIFTAIGVNMTDAQFKHYWEKAAGKDTNGQVCVESFREALEAAQKQNNS